MTLWPSKELSADERWRQLSITLGTPCALLLTALALLTLF